MKTTKILTILVLSLAVLVWPAEVSKAAPMGTGFTYQGRLIDANSAADGLYDFQFKLYDANVAGAQKGSTIDVNEMDVIDGYFTVLLDFGSNVFNGNTVWLEIGVRPGSLKDPNTYTTLSPRQEITPTPYALQTRGLFVDNAGNVGIGTTSPVATLDVTNPGGHTAISGKSSWIGVYGSHNSTTGTYPGVWGETDSLSSQASGVRGKVISTSPGSLSAGVWGMNAGTGSNGIGVRGTHDGSGTGVYGSSPTGKGVYGEASNSGNYTNYGGYFLAAGTGGYGVYGYASNSSDSTNYGGYFRAEGSKGYGVYGLANNNGEYYYNYGGYFKAYGVYGRGVEGKATGTHSAGVVGDGKEFDFYAEGPGTDYGSSSSIRWKRNIRPIDEALDKVMMLRGVYFNWDAEHGGGHDVGMIAEEVGQVLPEIVEYEENGIDTTGMDYSKLTPLLTEAIKELKAENDALKKRIEVLEAKMQQVSILLLEK
jgi:hypothetical protein